MGKESGIYRYNNIFITKVDNEGNYFAITRDDNEASGYFDELDLTLREMKMLYNLLGKCLKDQD